MIQSVSAALEVDMQLYGKGGRVFRCLWMLEEAGVEYERVPIDWAAGESHQPEFLALNANGKVPLLVDGVDGKVVLFESLAINYHLARHHAPSLWVSGTSQESLATQWLAWGMGELEGPHDAANRSKTSIDEVRLQVSLDALRRVLAEQAYLLGETFSVVDLNTACLLLRPQYQKIARQDAVLSNWFNACVKRKALTAAMVLD